MKKIGKFIIFPFLFLAFYFLFGMLLATIFPMITPLLLTVIMDIICGMLCLYYYKGCFHHDTKGKCIKKSMLFGFFILLIIMTLVGQITATWLYQTIGDARFDSYSNRVSDNAIVYMMLTLVIAPIFEELLLRGIFYNSFKNVVPKWIACILSAVVFAFMHGTLLHISIALLCGILFVIIYEYTAKLRYSMIAHSVSNLLSVLLGGIILPSWCFSCIMVVTSNLAILAVLIFLGRSTSLNGLKVKFGDCMMSDGRLNNKKGDV